jgi:O-antigen/teichoic acid export membrane protein
LKGLFRFPKNLPFLKESLASVIWRAISALAVGKIIAQAFGPAGTALFGQAMNLYGTLNNLPGDALARAMVREGAAAHGKGDDQLARRTAFSALILLLIMYLILALLSWQLSVHTSWFEPFLSTGGMPGFLLAFALLGLGSFSASWFLIWGKTQLQAHSASLMSMGGLMGLSIAWYWGNGFFDCLIAFFLGQAAGSIGWLLYEWKSLPPFFEIRFWDGILGWKLLRFALAIAGSGLTNLLIQYILVHWALKEMGPDQVGRWMAMNRLADVFNIPILAVANSILLPSMAALASNTEGLRNFLRPIFRQSLFWLVPGMLLLWLCYPLLLSLFFSKNFTADPALLPLQLAGDYFRSSTCVFAVLMLALGHTRFYFWLESASAVFMLAGTWVLFPKYGFASFFIVHAIRFLLYWAMIVFRYRRIFF